jgi:uncharacterized protein
MAQRTDVLDLGTLGLSAGEGRRLELAVAIDPLTLGGERYEPVPGPIPVVLDAARTNGGWALRVRFEATLDGPCMRCLEDAGVPFMVDAREVHQEGGGDDPELRSPYFAGEDLDLQAWARDALMLALPAQVVCREECRGLCAECGANLNEAAEHVHERAPDSRWAKLSEIRFE